MDRMMGPVDGPYLNSDVAMPRTSPWTRLRTITQTLPWTSAWTAPWTSVTRDLSSQGAHSAPCFYYYKPHTSPNTDAEPCHAQAPLFGSISANEVIFALVTLCCTVFCLLVLGIYQCRSQCHSQRSTGWSMQPKSPISHQ